jgi:hypothetical protein
MMKPVLTKTAAALIATLATLATSSPSLAVSPQSLVGDWTLNNGSIFGPCRLTLTLDNWKGRFRATTTCVGAMSFLDGWEPTPDGFLLHNVTGGTLGRFSPAAGGLRGQLSDGSSAVVARVAAPRPPATAFPGVTDHGGCILNPQTGQCASQAELRVPRGPQSVRVLHKLTMRAAPTYRSGIVGELQKGQCIKIEGCFETAAEMRCAVPLRGGSKGYIVRYFEQKGQTFSAFSAGC